MNLEAVIGLEIHVQLKTKSKMFCSCDNASEGALPNTLICPVCTGHPGTLPVPNRQAVAWAVMAATALGCTIPEHSKFDRKHYFYPDLPKGYQISQYDEPIGVHGKMSLAFDGRQSKPFGIERLHLEEDVGKVFHRGHDTLIDFNRAGTPLIEIVTEPDFRTPAEAKAFLQELRLTMRSLGVSDADMEKGHLRCDANISMRRLGEEKLYPKTEIKNVNSFRSVERALAYEIERQSRLWQAKNRPAAATRGWDEDANETFEQRTKEAAADYRYFPEPDIPPMHFTPEFLKELLAETPELPSEMRERFETMYGLSSDLAGRLAADRDLLKYFEETVSEFREYADSTLGEKPGEQFWTDRHPEACTLIATWLLNRISAEHRSTHGLNIPAQDLGRLLWMLFHKEITVQTAQQVFELMRTTKKGPHALVKELGLTRIDDDTALRKAVEAAISANPKIVDDIKAGKTAAMQFLVGQVMKTTKGQADAQVVRQLLEEELKD